MSNAIKSEIDQFHPTLMFGFQVNGEDEQVLCQMWVTPTGLAEYRPVPMVELNEKRKPCVTGYIEGDDD